MFANASHKRRMVLSVWRPAERDVLLQGAQRRRKKRRRHSEKLELEEEDYDLLEENQVTVSFSRDLDATSLLRCHEFFSGNALQAPPRADKCTWSSQHLKQATACVLSHQGIRRPRKAERKRIRKQTEDAGAEADGKQRTALERVQEQLGFANEAEGAPPRLTQLNSGSCKTHVMSMLTNHSVMYLLISSIAQPWSTRSSCDLPTRPKVSHID